MMECGRSLVYNGYLVDHPRLLLGYDEASSIVKFIIREFINHRKIIGSRELARKVIHDRIPKSSNILITDDDIEEAYAIGAGGGCEYEWPYL